MEMFEGTDTPLPVPTSMLLSFSDMLQQYWYIFIGVFITIVISIKQALKVKSKAHNR